MCNDVKSRYIHSEESVLRENLVPFFAMALGSVWGSAVDKDATNKIGHAPLSVPSRQPAAGTRRHPRQQNMSLRQETFVAYCCHRCWHGTEHFFEALSCLFKARRSMRVILNEVSMSQNMAEKRWCLITWRSEVDYCKPKLLIIW